ncbi:DNA translocase FtsK [Pukyongiella litopenaei]|uniref:DNA translocase FtsK n=1 Tax=Pukyongiella litopenaei TaxID=2605946 RepID=A0A2S0MMR6_9RHOB|nr:DNA translocase FtsK [Pukyongiella litopenaei]AVO37169.1 DNA translocase FtsK [Pukyongiella litopenaei]
MAYQTRSRDPLLDSNMQEALERRGRELIGIAMICFGLAVAAMIWSYSPDDPNWMVSTDAPVQNWLGRVGASVAAPLIMIAGKGAWGIALVAVIWGLRFALHWHADRAVGRLIFAPIAIALASVYAATLVPGAGWQATHSYGLGGLFGDTVLGAALTLLPLGSQMAVKLISFLLGVGLLALGAHVTGFTRPEIARGLRFCLVSLVMAYGQLMTLLGRGAAQAAQAARDHHAARAERRAAEAGDMAGDEDDLPDWSDPSAPSVLAKVPSFIRRPETMPEPELIEPEFTVEIDEPSGDRIRDRIANAIRARKGEPEPDPALPLTKGRGRRPEPLVLDPSAGRARVEPPVYAGAEPQEATAPVDAPSAPPSDPPGDLSGDLPGEPSSDPQPRVSVQDDALPLSEPEPDPMPIPVAGPRTVVMNPPRKTAALSTRAISEAQPGLAFDETGEAFELPPLSLLTNPVSIQRHLLSDEALEENARMLESVLDDYGVKGEIVSVRPGPVVTMYELEPAPGLKASRVIGLADDIARSMSALSARVSTVPGRSVIGIELPNENREKVVLREILASREFGDGNRSLPLALGKDIGGDPVVANLAKMPHLLIAGTTGSGKSVAINTMILSLLYKLTPEECRLIMIDPKMLELSVYDGIPHLLSPVVTDPKKAVVALKWVVGEMEDRYRKMSKMGVRNIAGYNGRVKDALSKNEMFSRTVQTGFDDETGEPVFETEEFAPEKLPYIVVIVDEMADLMMVAGKEIEACIQRLAQMARASGIHLIMATQRPSVDVITGTIKANFPTRISFQVTSKVDSRTILGEMGAEQLLGMGDMLYMAGGAKITRCHGPFVSDEEVEEVVSHLKSFGPPEYVGTVLDGPDDEKADDIDLVLGLGGNTNGEDALYDQAVQVVINDRKCSTSYIQRKLAIGYNKAARLVEQMEEQGLVSAANHVGKREILVPEPQ